MKVVVEEGVCVCDGEIHNGEGGDGCRGEDLYVYVKEEEEMVKEGETHSR
jgi:hypothetical protein